MATPSRWLTRAIGGPEHYVEAFTYLTWAFLCSRVALYLICLRHARRGPGS